jgi:DNA-binding response OmpR family regulator
MNAQVLCIEDDPDIALAVRLVLGRAGLTVIHAANGEDGLRMFQAERPEVVLLDVGLPAMDGWGVLERIRARDESTPVMMLTAHGLAADQFRGLHSGADDYLVKPFSNAELTSRVQLLLKQARAVRPGAARAYQDARLQVDFAAGQVTVDGQPVQLTLGEFRVLATLVRKAGQPVPAGELLEQAWNDPLREGQEQVTFTISRLAAKIGAGISPPPIEAVTGAGYRYVARPAI